MSVDRRLLNWGVFLVFLGGIPLVVSQGWVPRDLASSAWELWPLLLVGAGLAMILSPTPLRAIGGILVAVTFGVILGGIATVGFDVGGGFGCGGADAAAPQVVSERGSVDGASGTVTLSATCASVRISTGSGSAWDLAVAGDEASRPTLVRTGEGFATRSPEMPAMIPFGAHRSAWTVQLGTAPRLNLDLTVNAGDAVVNLAGATLSRLAFHGNAIGDTRFDLSRATVEQVDVSVNAADVTVTLPAAGGLSGSIQGNAAAVDLCAPAGVPLRFVNDTDAASNNFAEQGLVKHGNAWETPGYTGSAAWIELRTSGSAVSYRLNPEDGCE